MLLESSNISAALSAHISKGNTRTNSKLSSARRTCNQMTKSPKNYEIDKKMLSTGAGHKRAKTNEFRSFIIGGGQPSIT
jgi:hypothetical protein